MRQLGGASPRRVTDHEIRHRLRTAPGRFVTNDSNLLERNVGERAIAGALACHLAAQFPDHNVDVEYDRHGLERKSLNLPPACRGGGRKKVIPNIVIHRRVRTIQTYLPLRLRRKQTLSRARATEPSCALCVSNSGTKPVCCSMSLPAGPGAKGRKTKVEWTNRDPRTNTIKRQPR